LSGLSGNLGPLLRCEFVRTGPPALEPALATEGNGGGVAGVLGFSFVLVGGVRDDGRCEAVEVYGALA